MVANLSIRIVSVSALLVCSLAVILNLFSSWPQSDIKRAYGYVFYPCVYFAVQLSFTTLVQDLESERGASD
jgi:hypothetical protein